MRYRLHECIDEENLVEGAAYGGAGRNFNVAIWDGRAFHGVREKFGQRFIDQEIHWDVGGTFQPLKALEWKFNRFDYE